MGCRHKERGAKWPQSGAGYASASRWPHRLAIWLCCATFPLIWVGGLVTSYDAGMAVPDWPNTYGYNLLLYPWRTWLFGPWDLFLEHGHRLLGVLVGLLAITLVATVYRSETRRSLRIASYVALGLVIAQGCLGGARVLLDDRQLAMLHGCIGPAFFAFCAALATSFPTWIQAGGRRQVGGRMQSLRRFTLLTVLLVYVQLVLGAEMRHIPVTATPLLFNISLILHLTNALLLTSAIVVVALSLRGGRAESFLRRPAIWLVSLVALQVVLGVSTWIVKYGWPYWFTGWRWAAEYTIQAKSMLQTSVATLHMAVGSLILAFTVVLHMRLRRSLPAPETPTPSKQLAAGIAK